MKNHSSPIRKWRERKRAEGKKSFTVVLSKEAQKVLLSEKEKTGSSYSAIIEKALLGIMKPVYKLPTARHLPVEVFEKKGREIITKSEKSVQQCHVQPMIIDDQVDYSTPGKMMEFTGVYPYKSRSEDGFISRILKSSRNKLSREKKWFR